jgi:AcrR family transcriptional regulator
MTGAQAPDVRTGILDEAARLFVVHGYHGLSMREIAEAAHLSKAALYYHFADKEALFLAVLTRNLDDIGRIVQDARQAPATRAQVEHLVRAILRRAPDQRAIIRLASQELDHLSPAARAEFGRLYRDRFIGQVQAIMDEGIQRGELRPMDPTVATWLLLGMMYPFLDAAPADDTAAPDATAGLILTVFFDGATA